MKGRIPAANKRVGQEAEETTEVREIAMTGKAVTTVANVDTGLGTAAVHLKKKEGEPTSHMPICCQPVPGRKTNYLLAGAGNHKS